VNSEQNWNQAATYKQGDKTMQVNEGSEKINDLLEFLERQAQKRPGDRDWNNYLILL
jgi:hypothetical protein